MKIRSYLFLTLATLFFTLKTVVAQSDSEAERYIQKYKAIAMSEMKKYGIPASITLAQGLHESNMGKSRLAALGNNHFGIKCHVGWIGASMKHTDDAVDECFRVYDNVVQSYMDHSQFLLTRPRYAGLFQLRTNDYKGWAYGLKAAGYATNPQYAQMLISTIEKNQLFVYDMDLSDEDMETYRGNVNKDELKILADLKKKDVKVISNPSITIIPKTHPKQVTLASTKVFTNNGVKVVRVSKTETIESIAKQNGLSAYRLRDFNDLKPKENVKEGQLVYLASKKNRATQRKHKVLPGQTLWDISQEYAVKISKLQKRNHLSDGEEPADGVTIFLNRKAKVKPALKNKKAVDEIKEITVPLRNGNMEEGKKQEELVKGDMEEQKDDYTVADLNLHPFNYEKDLYLIYADHYQQKSQDALYHTVEKGDTLYNLSKKYNVTIQELKDWNNLFSDNLALGSVIVVRR
ncbi:MAG: LysM peptidoglycan-binding domain-containing protein [Chitinophagales bacterium]|nr:LysM peptidoglycan-binding domain-containing protein [Chitinophagales bacterium]